MYLKSCLYVILFVDDVTCANSNTCLLYNWVGVGARGRDNVVRLSEAEDTLRQKCTYQKLAVYLNKYLFLYETKHVRTHSLDLCMNLIRTISGLSTSASK